MKIIAFSGLGADERVFQGIKLPCELKVLPWVEFSEKETMSTYAMKMVEGEKIDVDTIFLGVSFGGMLVSELKLLFPENKCIIISSAESPDDLPGLYKWDIPLYKAPEWFFEKTKHWVEVFFTTSNKKLLFDILEDTDPSFVKNAIHLIQTWRKKEHSDVIRIHGDNDKVIPAPGKGEELIAGGHLVIVDQAEKISGYLKNILF